MIVIQFPQIGFTECSPSAYYIIGQIYYQLLYYQNYNKYIQRDTFGWFFVIQLNYTFNNAIKQ